MNRVEKTSAGKGAAESCFAQGAERNLTLGEAQLSFYEAGSERITLVTPRFKNPVGTVLLIHGLTDHSARQLDDAIWLARMGYRTVLFDLQGHGGRELRVDKSWWLKQAYVECRDQPDAVAERIRQRELEQPAFRAEVGRAQLNTLSRTSIDDHLAQLDRVLTQVLSSSWGELPLYLFGHSMGGLLCVEGIRRFGKRISRRAHLGAVVLMAPAFQPIGRPNRRTENALIDGFWKLSNRPSPSTSPLSAIRPAAKRILGFNFPLDVSWGTKYVSDEVEENRLIEADPFCHQTLPSAYISSIESQLVRSNQASLDCLPPTLLLLPQDDAIVNTKGSLVFAERARRAIGRSNVAIARFPYLKAHNLLRSSVRSGTRSVIADWLQGAAN